MNIHLIRSKGFPQAQYIEVVEFLQSFDGPVQFVGTGSLQEFNQEELSMEDVKEKQFFKQNGEALNFYRCDMVPEERLEASWMNLFNQCQQYRKEKRLPQNDLVLLLTEIANEHNWFSALDPSNTSNGFVHTAEWEHYVKCSEVFPVAYLVAALVLQKHMFKNMQSLRHAVHNFPLGCINDFCEQKQEVLLKLRTADVCLDCLQLLTDELKPLEIQQLLSIFEGVRLRMLFSQNFKQNLKPGRLHINVQGKIMLPDYGNIPIKLTPLEKTLYLLYLNHPEGILLPHLVDHKDELIKIYSRISTSGLLAEVHSRVKGLVDMTSNSASEKISKIKAAFVKAIGADLARQYYIGGEQGNKKMILLNRDLYLCDFMGEER